MIEPWSLLTVTCPSTPAAGGRLGTEHRDRRAGGVEQVRLVGHRGAVVEVHPPGGQHDLAAAGQRRSAGTDGRGGGPRAGPGAELVQLGPRLGGGAQVQRERRDRRPAPPAPGDRSSSSAWRTRRRSRGGGPPSSRRCPVAPRSARSGSTTSARSVTAEARASMLITKPTFSSPSSAAPGSSRSLGSTPATISAPSSASPAASSISSVSRPGSVGSAVGVPQAAAVSTRAAGSSTGRPPGSRLGRQPASTAPRSPARRGTQASRAPVRSASCWTAVRVPEASAARSPTRMTEPGPGSRSAGSSCQRARLGARSGGDQGGVQLVVAVAQVRRDGGDLQALLADRLAQPQEDRAGLLLRLEGDQQHPVGVLAGRRR